MGLANKSGMLHLSTGNRDRGATIRRFNSGKGAEAMSWVNIKSDPDGIERTTVLPVRFVTFMDRIFAPSGIVSERSVPFILRTFDVVDTTLVYTLSIITDLKTEDPNGMPLMEA